MASAGREGVFVLDAPGTVIGGDSSAGNVIGGTAGGIVVSAQSTSADDVSIVGNVIGITRSGAAISGTGTGVLALGVSRSVGNLCSTTTQSPAPPRMSP